MSINGRQDFKLRVNALFLDSCYMYGDGTKFYNLEGLDGMSRYVKILCVTEIIDATDWGDFPIFGEPTVLGRRDSLIITWSWIRHTICGGISIAQLQISGSFQI